MTTLEKFARCIATVCALLSLAARAEAQNEPFQNVPLPAELPKGVSVAQAKKLQAYIDAFRLEEPLAVSKLKIANIVLHTDHESGIAALPAGVTIVANQDFFFNDTATTERDRIPPAY